jgi:lipopolysaccharide transport system ATP-binding protein
MMSDVAIHAEGLGKQYHLGQLGQNGNKTLRESLVDLCSAPLRRTKQFLSGRSSASKLDDVLWALRDASFEIKQGEVVGLIGRNGAGKSTVLKVLSRITEPTCGYVDVHGRIGSLLEVGTGFHNELSGRENIFLNGAILGMRKAEIQRKFDEIVEFSQIERFLDTPVKHYSSGMYVRLAFAVAAHLEPEILLVDEVLAVGDARFQKKCLNKMEDVAHGGRTVIFVSHNMSAVTRICQRAILLDEGRIACDGPTHEVVSSYLNDKLGTTASREWPDIRTAPGGDICRLRAVKIHRRDGTITDTVDIRDPLGIAIEFDVTQPGHLLLPHIHVWNDEGVELFAANDLDPAWRRRRRPAGRYVTTGWIPGNLLAEGMVFIDVAVICIDPINVQIYERSIAAFQVIDSMDGDSARGDYAGPMPGVVRPMLEWTTQYRPVETFTG